MSGQYKRPVEINAINVKRSEKNLAKQNRMERGGVKNIDLNHCIKYKFRSPETTIKNLPNTSQKQMASKSMQAKDQS